MRFALVLAVAAVLFNHSAVAAEGHGEHYAFEITGGTTAALRLGTGDNSRSTYLLTTGIAVPISEPMLDVALDLDFLSTDLTVSGERSTEIAPVAGLQLNLGEHSPFEAFFLFAGAGISYLKEGDASLTEFTYRFRGGKRFALTSSVCYAPFVQYGKVNGAQGVVTIVPFAFSLFL